MAIESPRERVSGHSRFRLDSSAVTGRQGTMKRALVLLIGVLMCVISILLFTSPIDVFDRDDQPKPTKLSEALQSSPTKAAARLAPTEIAPNSRTS